jgi:ribonucleoside-diphosphate reductase alpha chain
MGLWEKVKDKIIADQGDIANIDGIPQHIKDVYKTSFSTSPYAFIEVAARAQKWIDQALSRNMYLETRDIGETMDIYSTAWKKGLKSTYYLHMKPRHTAEQSTVHVNKAEKLGKRGFAAVVEEPVSVAVAISEPQMVDAVASFMKTPVSVTPAVTEVPEVKVTPVVSINPTETTPKAAAATVMPEMNAEPVRATKILPPSDPMEDNLCDSCQ